MVFILCFVFILISFSFFSTSYSYFYVYVSYSNVETHIRDISRALLLLFTIFVVLRFIFLRCLLFMMLFAPRFLLQCDLDPAGGVECEALLGLRLLYYTSMLYHIISCYV